MLLTKPFHHSRKTSFAILAALSLLLVGCALKQWGIPYQISEPLIEEDAFMPALTQHSSGKATALWVQSLNEHTRIMASRFDGLLWEKPVQIDQPTASGLSISVTPVAVTGNTGVVTAAWLQWDGRLLTVNSSRHVDGLWSQPEKLGTATNIADVTRLSMTVDSNGSVTVAWEQDDNTLMAARSTAGIWQPAQMISDSAIGSRNQAMVVDPQGRVTLLWDELKNNVRIIQSRRWLPETHMWEAPQEIGSGGNISAVASSNGDVTASWATSAANGLAIITARHYRSGTWSPPETITSAASSPAMMVTLPNGKPMAVWHASNAGQHALMASGYTNGIWEAPIKAQKPASMAGEFSLPGLAVDVAGNVTAVWEQELQANGSSSHAIISNRLVQGAWQVFTQIDSPNLKGHAATPAIASDGAGNVLAIWNQISTNDHLVINANQLK